MLEIVPPSGVAVVVVVGAYLAFTGTDNNGDTGVIADPTANMEPTATPVQPTPTSEPVVQVESSATIVEPTATIAPAATATTAVSATLTPLPTPTELPPSPQAAPTATRVPLPTAVPTATPIALVVTLVDPLPEISDVVPWELLPVPEELKPTSEPLSTSEVIDKWVSFLTEKRVVMGGSVVYAGKLTNFGNKDHVFCQDGRGFFVGVPDYSPNEFVGQTFRWTITHSPAAAWHSPILGIQPENPNVWIACNAVDAGTDPQGILVSRPLVVGSEKIVVDGERELSVHQAGELSTVCSSLPSEIN